MRAFLPAAIIGNPFYLGAGYLVFIYDSPFTGGGTYEPPISFSATVVPEPVSTALLLSGLSALPVMRRRGAATAHLTSAGPWEHAAV